MSPRTPVSLPDSVPAFFDAPPSTDPALVGIARMAAASERQEERNRVDYRWIDCRRVLNRVDGSRVRFEWSINPYRGCEFGCSYCYARYTHEFMNHAPEDFDRLVYMKREAARTLRADLLRGPCRPGETIAIGAATDPYQPAERRFGLTREILEVLAGFRGFRVEIVTKSDLVLRDADVLKRIDGRHDLVVNVTVTTTDAALARDLEPRAPTPRSRLAAVSGLRREGLRAGVFLMPVLPGITDDETSIGSVVRAAADAGAAFVAHQVLFLPKASKAVHFEKIRGSYPHLLPLYRAYYDRSIDAPREYRDRIAEVVRAARRECGIGDDRPRPRPSVLPAPRSIPAGDGERMVDMLSHIEYNTPPWNPGPTPSKTASGSGGTRWASHRANSPDAPA